MQHLIEVEDLLAVVQQLAKQRSIATNCGENALSYFFNEVFKLEIGSSVTKSKVDICLHMPCVISC